MLPWQRDALRAEAVINGQEEAELAGA